MQRKGEYTVNKEFGAEDAHKERADMGNKILDLLGEHTKNPSEAFVLLHQLSLYLWDQYKLDWKSTAEHKVADSRKQRYIDFVADMVNCLNIDEQAKEAG